ncbi:MULTISPECIES: G8 domain-containing protein [unclassified Roseovarius]|uniref:G8 domain-containing protein n=1 Tax=unclassified Roseovarius TaxID=2614913 RepID=UPI00273EA6E9|nr:MULTISPECIES: G8 domain-containing protein [unclassified Roseovarius]
MLHTSDLQVLVNDTGSTLTSRPYPVQQDNNGVGGGDPETEALTYIANATETYDQNAFIDPMLQRDIDSIKSYCARSNADVIAVASGAWSDATTWWSISGNTQRVPQPGENILIPAGVNVTYDQISTTEYNTIRVDGGFIWADDRSTELHCDTIFVDHTGTYELASESAPASESFTQTLIYTNNGPLDVTNDPVKMQRGLVCFGKASIFATPVIGIARAAGGIPQGATSVTLDRQVQNVSGFRDWKPGDEIIIPGTRMRGMNSQWEPWETEIRTITAVDNSTPSAPVISWSGGLNHPHPACFRRAAFTPHIVNRTRNFRTSTDGAPSDAQRRAHQLFKNKDQNTVEYVEAWGMGRTDMDFKTLGTSPVMLSTMPTITSTTNTNGRYIWHFHRNGADDPTLNPSVFRGCVGYDSPGWVFVHHDSHGKMIDCIAHDFQAVGFAGEGGGSWGEINGCIAIGTREPWAGPSTARIKDGGNKIGDIGHGFWSNSRPLNFRNCIAADCTVGMAWTSRVSFGTNVYPGITEELRAFYGLAADPSTDVQKTFAVIEGFEHNEVYACNWGGSVAKRFPVQHHDLVSFMDGFKAWEVDVGFHWQYTGMYSMKDFDVIGFNPANRSIAPYAAGIGLWPFRQTVSMVFMEPRIEAFSRGIDFTTVGGDNTRTNKAQKVVGPVFTDCTTDYAHDGTSITLPWSALNNGVVDAEEIPLANLGSNAAGAVVPDYLEDSCTWAGDDNHFVIADDFGYTDSIGYQKRYKGVPNTEFGWGDRINGQNEANQFSRTSKDAGILVLITRTMMQQMMKQEGVYTSAAGDKVLLIPDVVQDRTSGLSTYFYTPVALRMPANEFNAILPGYATGVGNNGVLGTVNGQDFTSFNPAGTNGLT